ncbi:MAG: precorrin-8X methylmutase [Thermodesulfobacteriaceae bacterium]|nr:precorrin-8X methylmutase [Thermodesulfobacteriaceae bacterium]
MEKLLVVLHGSPRKEANSWEPFLKFLANYLQLPEENLSLAYLQFGRPSIEEALNKIAMEGATKIIVHPFFLSAGQHVTQDIPAILRNFQKEYPKIEFIYTNPIGFHEKLAEIVKERIEEKTKLTGQAIEKRSFEIIEEEVDLSKFSEEEREIVKRVIHATADFEFKDTMLFHKEAIPLGLTLLREGKDILVDVEMIRSGINKRYMKNRVLCYLSEIEEEGEGTRTEKAIEKALREEKNIGIIAIGNSPTALLKAIEILKEEKDKKFLIIGMPVGFVKALESKILLSTQSFPFITNLSRKGGTPACVAVVNALMKLAFERKEN